MHTKPLPDREFALSWWCYDVDSGLLFWLRRPTVRSRVRVGDVAGTVHRDGYVQIGLHHKVYQAHRLIWKMQTGADPIDEIDHVNGVRNDNRWVNLRAATRSQQGMNKPTPNFHRGVHFIAKSGKYGAQIKAYGKHIWLGVHNTPESACAAYRAKAEELHGEFAKPGQCSCL